MHELSLSGAIVDTVLRHAGGRRVTLVSLRVGALRQVVPDTLAFYFQFVARGTACEGARLEQETVPARLRCEDCELEWSIEIPAFRCPRCESGEVRIASGDELAVESIEVVDEAGDDHDEQEAAARSAPPANFQQAAAARSAPPANYQQAAAARSAPPANHQQEVTACTAPG